MGQISPDGRWLLYASNESGILQVYVQNFPEMTRKIQISRESGTMPRWREDGKEILYVSLDRKMRAIPVNITSDAVTVGESEVLMDAPIEGSIQARTHQWCMSPDAQTFYFTEVISAEAPDAHLIVNWLE